MERIKEFWQIACADLGTKLYMMSVLAWTLIGIGILFYCIYQKIVKGKKYDDFLLVGVGLALFSTFTACISDTIVGFIILYWIGKFLLFLLELPFRILKLFIKS